MKYLGMFYKLEACFSASVRILYPLPFKCKSSRVNSGFSLPSCNKTIEYVQIDNICSLQFFVYLPVMIWINLFTAVL